MTLHQKSYSQNLEKKKKNRKRRGEQTSIMEMTSSESLVIHKSEKGKKNFGNVIDDTMVCSLIKQLILIRLSILIKEIMSFGR